MWPEGYPLKVGGPKVARATNPVLIVNGSQQALDLICRTLLDPGDRVVIESPTYTIVLPLLAQYRAHIDEAPMTSRGMDLGASDYITKPFEESELLSAVASRLKRRAIMEGSFQETVIKERKWRIEDMEEAFAHKERIEYRPGTTIYCEGNIGNHMKMLKS